MRQTLRYESGNLVGLPEEIAQKLTLHSGDELEIAVVSPDGLVLTPVRAGTVARQRLVTAWKSTGLLDDHALPASKPEPAWKQLLPITVAGEPMSETIIRDRNDDR